MFCPGCSRLALLQAVKKCVRCQGAVNINLSVICDSCSTIAKQCAVCLKRIVTTAERNAGRGCGCKK
jgi:hypothetical protein